MTDIVIASAARTPIGSFNGAFGAVPLFTGTLLIAAEGINGTVSGSRAGIDGLLTWLKRDPRFVDIDHKESYCDEQPFYRSKVKLKKEIAERTAAAEAKIISESKSNDEDK